MSLEDLEDTLGGHALDKLVEDPAPSAESALDQREAMDELRRAVAQLPPAERAVPLGTLLSRKHRAVQKLKKTLKASQ